MVGGPPHAGATPPQAPAQVPPWCCPQAPFLSCSWLVGPPPPPLSSPPFPPPPSPPLPTLRSHQAPLLRPPRCPWGLRATGRQAGRQLRPLLVAAIDEDVLRYRFVKKKGYVRLHTNLGDLNLELHCDLVGEVAACECLVAGPCKSFLTVGAAFHCPRALGVLGTLPWLPHASGEHFAFFVDAKNL